MRVFLYSNSAEKNRVDKTQYLKTKFSFNGVLRDSCSVTKPIITFDIRDIQNVIKTDGVDVVDTNAVDVTINDVIRFLSSCNYAYIEEFKRYYFITDIISVKNNLWQINMRVDVLMSHTEQIKLLSGIIERQENIYNDYLVDNQIQFQTNWHTETIEYPNTFFETTNDDEYHYVMNVVESNTGGVL